MGPVEGVDESAVRLREFVNLICVAGHNGGRRGSGSV